ncbi:MAG TPA: hypothetical protein DCQ06_12550 [Myxococcales bacterium]|nr:hypothetical protein [Myxococcales bacterium]HAN32417.1 hypothetical protein [Myxococcales bacterium]
MIQVLWLTTAVIAMCAGCQIEAIPSWRLVGSQVQQDGLSGSDASATPPCRAALTGEMVINEVMVRPSEVDVDGDGISDSKDEYIELVSRATEPIHLRGAELWFNGLRRGEITSSGCVDPRHAFVLFGSMSAARSEAFTSKVVYLDRTLRLADRSATIEIRSVSGSAIDEVDVAAPVTSSGIVNWNRTRAGDWYAPFQAHDNLSSRPWSVGRCVDGGMFPSCLRWIDAMTARQESRW